MAVADLGLSYDENDAGGPLVNEEGGTNGGVTISDVKADCSPPFLGKGDQILGIAIHPKKRGVFVGTPSGKHLTAVLSKIKGGDEIAVWYKQGGQALISRFQAK